MIELNKLYNDDALNILRQLPDKSVDMVLTDPPYGINLEGFLHNTKVASNTVLNDDSLVWLPAIVTELKRVLKSDGVMYIFSPWSKFDVFKQEFEKEFILNNVLVWDKSYKYQGQNWKGVHEFIMMLSNVEVKRIHSSYKTNILRHKKVYYKKMIHLCEKPVPLLEEIIIEHPEASVILDCFAGSCSTLVAALNCRRQFIGVELDKKIFEIGQERLNDWYVYNS